MCGIGQLRVTRWILWQGEERDSSDEEWEVAYRALDPISQIAWPSCRAEIHAVGTDLVRDVFAAADEMHDNAMSAVDGSTRTVHETPDGVDGAGEASATHCTEGSSEDVHAMEVDIPGERFGWVCIVAVTYVEYYRRLHTANPTCDVRMLYYVKPALM